MEAWDIYDKDRCKTGRIGHRGERLREGEYHMTVHICIFSADGRMLIQQRTDDKATWPGLWDITAAGSALAGESSREAAERELWEELGLKRDFSEMRPRFTVNYQSGFGDYYYLTEDVEPDTLVLQESEVQAARYATLEEVLALLSSDCFIPYHESFVRFLFDTRERWGTHTERRDLMLGKRG